MSSTTIIPQHPKDSDLYIEFEFSKDFFDGPSACVQKLADIDDFIFALSIGRLPSDPILTLKYSTDSSRFSFDYNHNIVSIYLTAAECSAELREYFCNLWVEKGSKIFTNLTQKYRVVDSVFYGDTHHV